MEHMRLPLSLPMLLLGAVALYLTRKSSGASGSSGDVAVTVGEVHFVPAASSGGMS